MEPRASAPAARLRAIRELSTVGVPVRVLVAPVIPGLTDAELPAILKAARAAGARSASYVLLRLPGAVGPVFLDWLARVRPEAKGRIEARVRDTRAGRLNDPRFGSRMAGTGELAEQGLGMGIGTTLALAISYIAGFAKIGWAPSAVGNVVRYDDKLSRKRAWARFFGTLGGAAIAALALAFITDPTIVVLIAAVFAVLNGLFKLTVLGKMPLFYTATILLLYTANDLTSGSENVLTRVFYNVVGITIGVLVVIYPFPRMLKMINPKATVE
jgi:hypothetical protein